MQISVMDCDNLKYGISDMQEQQDMGSKRIPFIIYSDIVRVEIWSHDWISTKNIVISEPFHSVAL